MTTTNTELERVTAEVFGDIGLQTPPWQASWASRNCDHLIERLSRFLSSCAAGADLISCLELQPVTEIVK